MNVRYKEGTAYLVPAVAKAIKILQHLADQSRHGWTVTELAEALDLPKATIYRIVITLEAGGVLEKEESRNRYYLGPVLARWAENYVPNRRYAEIIRPFLEEISAATKESVQLATREGHQTVIIDKVDSSYMVRAVAWIGRRTPLHCSSLGKALLSLAPTDLLKQYLSARLEKMTPYTITDPDEIVRIIDRVREEGYAVDKGEVEEGLWCFGVPLMLTEEVPLAISVSGPAQRMVRKQESIIQILMEVKKNIEEALKGKIQDPPLRRQLP
ncbi:MAG: IclR family transcriptional regulator [Hydrogenibacillus schlegelii]|nr:IclR family transcriptional regulator [Hydrogenibacillus schlegelii]